MHNLLIKSSQGNYEVDFYHSLDQIVEYLNKIENSIIIIDKNIFELYTSNLSKIKSTTNLILEATEDNKSFENIKTILDFLQKNNCNKSHTVIAIGGGIIQDIVAFTTHIYFRGIPWIFVPTTLLAMCDSCIGAKCGINVNEFKNQVGVFHSPSKVLISEEFLESLPSDQLQSGYGEILKHFLIESWDLFDSLEQELSTSGFKNKRLMEFIYLSLKIKQKVVEADEYEQDYRRILNYGHSFGHALEPLSNFAVPHGTAVAWGIDLINYIACQRGLISDSDFNKVHRFTKKFFSIQLEKNLTAKQFIDFAKTDKKVKNGKINLVFMKDPGNFTIEPVKFDDELVSEITAYLNQYNFINWAASTAEIS